MRTNKITFRRASSPGSGDGPQGNGPKLAEFKGDPEIEKRSRGKRQVPAPGSSLLLSAKKMTRGEFFAVISGRAPEEKGERKMLRNHGWSILASLIIVLAIGSPANAAGVINLNPGAVYHLREFDRDGKWGEKHLPSAFWWGEEARKKAKEKMARVDWSVDPSSGKLLSVSIAGGVGADSRSRVSLGMTLMPVRGTNHEIAARARVTVEGEYKGSLTVFGVAAATATLKTILSSDDGAVHEEATILDHKRILAGLASYQSPFATKVYEGEIRSGRGYYLDVELLTGAGAQQAPDLPIPGEGTAEADFGISGYVKVHHVKVEILGITKNAPPCNYEVPESVSFSHEAESEIIQIGYQPAVCAPLNWTVNNPNPWITVRDTVRRESGGQFRIAVTANPGNGPRTGTLTLAGKSIRVTQEGATGCEYRVNPEKIIFFQDGGSQVLSVSLPSGCTGRGWTAAARDKWISIQESAGGAAGGTVRITVPANGNSSPRSGMITVAGKKREIVQYGARPCTYLTEPAILYVGSEAGSYGVWVKGKNLPGAPVGPQTCNPFLAFQPVADVPWLSPLPGRNPGLLQILSVVVAENPASSMRTGMIYISPTGQTLEVRQLGAGKPLLRCDFQVPPVFNLPAGERTETLTVTPTPAGCTDPDAWQAESHDPWIEIRSAGRNASPGTLTIRVASNDAWYEKDKRGPGPPKQGRRHETNPRTGSLTIAGQTVVVNQAGSLPSSPAQVPVKDQPLAQSTPPCTYQVQSEIHVARTQQKMTLKVNPVSPGCTEGAPWEAASNVAWITVDQVDRKSRPGSVTITIKANPGAHERSGTLTIAGKKVTVSQRGQKP